MTINSNNNDDNDDDNDKRSYLFQKLSVIIQHFNSVLIHNSFVSVNEEQDL